MSDLSTTGAGPAATRTATNMVSALRQISDTVVPDSFAYCAAADRNSAGTLKLMSTSPLIPTPYTGVKTTPSAACRNPRALNLDDLAPLLPTHSRSDRSPERVRRVTLEQSAPPVVPLSRDR